MRPALALQAFSAPCLRNAASARSTTHFISRLRIRVNPGKSPRLALGCALRNPCDYPGEVVRAEKLRNRCCLRDQTEETIGLDLVAP